jgi:hypothetical protein
MRACRRLVLHEDRSVVEIEEEGVKRIPAPALARAEGYWAAAGYFGSFARCQTDGTLGLARRLGETVFCCWHNP